MILLKNASYYKEKFVKSDILFGQGNIFYFDYSPCSCLKKIKEIDANDFIIIPSFVDVHTHLREPGFFYKESIKTGTAEGLKNGYTCLFNMPNLNPCPDSVENLKVQQDIINRDAVIDVLPYGAVTINEDGKQLSDMEGLSNKVIAFSDDGKGLQSSEIMEKAMEKAARLNKIIAAHCEDNSLTNGGYIHKGEYAKRHGHIGISSESEYIQIARDIELVKKTGCAYHVCHVSTKESVDIIRKAKQDGVDVTCETAPHYLVLSDNDLQEDGRFKMNPPLRSLEDKNALIDGLNDGTIDIIATDHAPHSVEEKSKGLKNSLFGIVGLSTAFPILYTELVLKNKTSLLTIIRAMSINPRKRFGLDLNSDYAVIDLSEKYTIRSSQFLSKGKATPFDGWTVYGKNKATVKNGEIIWNELEEN